VVRANSRRDKVPVLLELREEVEQLKVVEIDAVRLRGAFPLGHIRAVRRRRYAT